MPQSLHKYILFFLVLFCPLHTVKANNPIPIPSAPEIAANSFVLIDFNSQQVLAENNANKRLAPASLTKIMTVYVIFQELKSGHLTLDEKVTISKKAWQTPGSRMFVEVNTEVTVENLLKGVIIQSGNDASVALAEHVAGNESTFAILMNQYAERLGMLDTHFENSMGLPRKNHYTTANDLAKLTIAIIAEFPEYYRWDSIKEFTYNKITQANRNKLLWRDKSVDGVKTGYTKAAGYCMVASAKREDMRLISVVMGAKSEKSRINESQNLLNYGFRFFETHQLYTGQETLNEERIWKGERQYLPVGLLDNLYVTIPRRHYNDLTTEIKIDKTIIAPVKAGGVLGYAIVSLAGEVVVTKPLVAFKSVSEGSFLSRLYDEVMLLME